MASPAQPPTSQTTLSFLDDLKPSINASGDSGLIEAIATNDAFPASLANITVGELSGQVTPGGQFKLPRVNGVPVGFFCGGLGKPSLAAYQNPANLPSDPGFTDTDCQQLNVSFPSAVRAGSLWSAGALIFPAKSRGKMALDSPLRRRCSGGPSLSWVCAMNFGSLSTVQYLPRRTSIGGTKK